MYTHEYTYILSLRFAHYIYVKFMSAEFKQNGRLTLQEEAHADQQN